MGRYSRDWDVSLEIDSIRHMPGLQSMADRAAIADPHDTAYFKREESLVLLLRLLDESPQPTLADVPAEVLVKRTKAGGDGPHPTRAMDQLVIGPWSHMDRATPVGERNFGVGSQAGMLELRTDLASVQLRWFDHWLKGRDTGMAAEAPIRVFVMGAHVWREEQEWPLARTVATPWYLHAGGILSPESPQAAEAPHRYTYDPERSVPTLGSGLLMSPEYPPGPYDQRPIEARPDVLVYTSPPLEREVEVTGPITVRLWAVSSAPDTDLVARLTGVFPDGRSFNLTDGIVRARYRDYRTGRAPMLIVPGRAYEYEIDCWATSNVLQRGHRIRLQVTSSCFPSCDRNPNTGHPFGADAERRIAQQQILHDGEHASHVILPIVPAGAG